MTLLPRQSPLEEVWVAIDLETTGLSMDSDVIIEVGAVKFQGERVLETFQSFVNPHRRLSEFIRRFTGIQQSDVDGAPPFSAVAPRLAAFVGSAPVLGHNIPFDLGFLAKSGLRLSNPRCDTWDLAFVLHPGLKEYALGRLAAWLGVPHPEAHRAVSDAAATMGVFLRLVEEASRLDVYLLAEMQRLAARSQWLMGYLLRGLEAYEIGNGGHLPNLPPQGEGTGGISRPSATGLDMQALARRLQPGRALRPNHNIEPVDSDFVVSLLREGSKLAEAIPGFEERAEQVAMARVVTEAINKGQRLIVEAGTGVGKSLAYLLPSVVYALANNRRVVVSTNTINLQEQLANKDIPMLVKALAGVDGVAADGFRATVLKGRANYLCMRRWAHLRSSESLTDHEARLLAKVLVWLQTTSTGDRAELNLGNRDSSAPWGRLSGQGAFECIGMGGPCFVRAARERAAASHLIIVNHALLLSDVTAGGALIPDYDILIIDEAHHLEEEATKHLGFEVGQGRIDELTQSLSGDRGLLNEAVTAFRVSRAGATRREAVEKTAADIAALLPRLRDHAAMMFSTLSTLLTDGAEDGGPGQDYRVTMEMRRRPGWEWLGKQWENVDLALGDLAAGLRRLNVALEGLENANLANYEGILMEVVNAQQTTSELRQKLAEFVEQPKPDGVYWVTRASTPPQSPPASGGVEGSTRGRRQGESRTGKGGTLTLHAAPLHVGETLEKLLFSQKECVVMTSATLSAEPPSVPPYQGGKAGGFTHVRERTGFAGAKELLLGSPFDYSKAALLCVPEDMPEPGTVAYPASLQKAISDAALTAGGRTMALFTSYAALHATASAIRSDLAARGIEVLAQGIDGTPNQMVRRFLDSPESVVLGTASFWEGVDLAGDALMVLLVARLPFSVPTEPVFAARSELYEDPFNEYALPQAILRLRQGFGRLIRTKSDRGVAIILDRRIVSRSYGRAFLKSLPGCTFRRTTLARLPEEIKSWTGSRAHADTLR